MKQACILVVDDDAAVREVYSEMLRTQGARVWEAATGRQALELTRERRPDLVVLTAGVTPRMDTSYRKELETLPPPRD